MAPQKPLREEKEPLDDDDEEDEEAAEAAPSRASLWALLANEDGDGDEDEQEQDEEEEEKDAPSTAPVIEDVDADMFSGIKKKKKAKGKATAGDQQVPDNDDDVDAILAQLEAPKPAAEQASKKVKKKGKKGGAQARDEEDIDALLAQFEAPKELPAPSPALEKSEEPAQESQAAEEAASSKNQKKGKGKQKGKPVVSKVKEEVADDKEHEEEEEAAAPSRASLWAALADDEDGQEQDEPVEEVASSKNKKKGKGTQKGKPTVSKVTEVDDEEEEEEEEEAAPSRASLWATLADDEDEQDEPSTPPVIEDVDADMFAGMKKKKKPKAQAAEQVPKDNGVDAIVAQLETPKPAAEQASKKVKKKGKKGGAQATAANDDEDIDALLAQLEAPKEAPVPSSKLCAPPAEAVAAEPAPADDAEGAAKAEEETASKNKKKKDKKKAKAAAGKAGEGEQEQPADEQKAAEQPAAPAAKGGKPAEQKKVSAKVRAMQERLAKMQEEEDRRKQEEEERIRKEQEEEARRLEEERLKEEAKKLKKQREKEKIAQKKKEGTYLNEKQRAEARRLAMMREQLLAQQKLDDEREARDEGEEGGAMRPKKEKVVYGKKKKAKPEQQESVSESLAEAPETTAVPTTDLETEQLEAEQEAAAAAAEEETVALAAPAEEEEEEEEEWDAKSWDAEDIVLPPVKRKGTLEEEEEEEEEETVSLAAKSEAERTRTLEKKPAAEKPAARGTSPAKSVKEGEAKQEKKPMSNGSAAKPPASHDEGDLRSPICCILGHVDTGKTKLLDKIRRTNVQEGEAGGITQQIGATYFPMDAIKERTASLMQDVITKVPGLLVIDTPGHESFTNLRSRGSSLCDIAILVIDIMHGLEPQTIESINLLKMRKTPFVVALNKVDRMYDWQPQPNAPIRDALKSQKPFVQTEFEQRLAESMTALAEQGLNAALYYKNPDARKFVSVVPTSAITGEGVPDLLLLLVKLTEKMMGEKLAFVSELQCTVLEVKMVEGHGTTIDVVLVNGVLHEGDRIVVCGMQGPIVTSIRSLLTPHPMKELRVKGSYLHHKEIKAAMGIKIAAHGLEHAVAGTQLYVVGPDQDEDDVKEEAMQDFESILSSVDKSGLGVCVQASTLGSLEALLTFLKSPEVNIPVSGIGIGPVHKKEIMRASVMLERNKKEYAVILCFDVKVTPEAREMADELGVRIFTADIIYHLFDQFTAYMAGVREAARRDSAEEAVFPCVLKIIPNNVFNQKDPIVLGVDVLAGVLRIGTPLCIPSREFIDIGKVASIENNHKAQDKATRGQAVAVKIQSTSPDEAQKMFGRHFDAQDELVSRVSRRSIDLLKENFRNDLSKEDWQLVVRLKKVFSIP